MVRCNLLSVSVFFSFYHFFPDVSWQVSRLSTGHKVHQRPRSKHSPKGGTGASGRATTQCVWVNYERQRRDDR